MKLLARAGSIGRAALMVLAALIFVGGLITAPHIVTVWRVMSQSGNVVEYTPSQVQCENDAINHNQQASDVNIYGRYTCTQKIRWQWGW